jgi:4-oxalomesaconate hydratase
MTTSKGTLLVVSAHAADFVWRAGGAIALYASRGFTVRVLCLSFGERGESQGLWKQDGMTLARVKEVRQAECERAAGVLGAEVRFFDAGDYPLRASDHLMEELVQEFRHTQPLAALTHCRTDPYNSDHDAASRITTDARVYAQANGFPSPHGDELLFAGRDAARRTMEQTLLNANTAEYVLTGRDRSNSLLARLLAGRTAGQPTA